MVCPGSIRVECPCGSCNGHCSEEFASCPVWVVMVHGIVVNDFRFAKVTDLMYRVNV